MGIRIECDWCHQPIKAGDPYVTIAIDGAARRGAEQVEVVSEPPRVYCGADRYEDLDPATHGATAGRGDGWGHRESCYKRVRAALSGNPEGRADMGLEWRLVPQVMKSPDYIVDVPISEMPVSARTRAALKKAGIERALELAELTEAQWLGIPGIARGGLLEIRAALQWSYKPGSRPEVTRDEEEVTS